ncbi:FecR family protein [Leptolyngbya sp. AN02str]|uniref:FecR family protein n=1 Tax=Leptolyngbya sp. AN02str TaxID=3423363 RepID=UPI003D317D90
MRAWWNTIDRRSRRSLMFLAWAVLAFWAVTAFTSAVSQVVPVRVNRWIEVRQISGTVNFFQGGSSRAARVGDRLQTVGDGIATAPGATAILAVDTGIGFVNVTENTRVQVQALAYAPDDGRITRLFVSQGQVRLQIRQFTNPGSELEIQTPAGTSAVRGTEFGVAVQQSGKTGVATLEGSVETAAQGEIVPVSAGFQNFTIPGEPPSPAVPLRDDTSLQRRIDRIIVNGRRQVRLVGQVDPVNTVLVEGRPQTTTRDGEFTLLFSPQRGQQSPRISVITPLGRRQDYIFDISI